MKALLLTIMLTSLLFAQYDADIDRYNIYCYELVDTTITPDISGYYNYEFAGDTTVILSWTHGAPEPLYDGRYNVMLSQLIVIPNTVSLWGIWNGTSYDYPDTAYTSESLVLSKNRWYEITATSVDVLGNESERCKQFYIRVPSVLPGSRAKIVVDLRIGQI